jgi:dolichyl-phosphate beta-glucosyltransferase
VARPVIPPFVASGAWRSYVGPDQSVLVVPLSNWDNYTGMLWAASTGLDMKMSHGYFLGPTGAVNGSQAWPGPAPRPTNLLLDAATYTRNVPKITEADRVRAREDLAYWHTAIIMTPDQPATRAIRATINGLVGPGQLVGGVWVWDVGRR